MRLCDNLRARWKLLLAMDRFVLRLVSLLPLLWSAQHCWGAIVELNKFRDKSSGGAGTVVDVTFAADGHWSPRSAASEQARTKAWKRDTSGQPHIDGTHQFHDGYRRGSIYYAGGTSQVIVVLTYYLRNGVSIHSNLYRSTNYGKSFTKINSQVGNGTLYQRYYSNGNTLVYVHSTSPQLFYSIDQGATFSTVNLSPASLVTTTVVYHPSRDGWMLMSDSFNRLYMTENYGRHWTRIADNVDDYQWADADWDDDDRRIYFTTADKGVTNPDIDTSFNLYTSRYPYSGGPTEFDPNLGDHDGFLLVGRYIFAQRTDNNDVVALYVSDRRQPFQRAMIPLPDDHESYLVTHINDMQALVIVEHNVKNQGSFYNLYLSEETGVYYSLSLRDIVIESHRNYRIDLELIEGVNGTLIANQYTREDVSDRNSSIRTVISLDNGGFWEGLMPPVEDVDGNTTNCEPPDCSLHLHMDTTEYARLGVYSTESAPGIIVAHGTVGEELTDDPDLYISRDGGVSWEQILAGSWGVNVADHGGLMVAAKDYHQEPSTALKYSCNEGYTWRDFSFIDPQTSFTVFGLLTEPGQHTTIISVYGGPWRTDVPFEWTVVTIDFAGIFPRQCQDSDYYDWRPWDERTESNCILGSTVAIERRKPQVCCLNGRDYDREVDYRICPCTSEDYGCDYGFARPSIDIYAPCMRDYSISLPNPCADGKTETYWASTGYRKIAGDVCKGGEDGLFEKFKAPCCGKNTLPPFFPSQQPDGPETDSEDHHLVAALVAVGALFGMACVVACVFMILCCVVTSKYRMARKRYLRVMTAGEPDIFTYSADTHRDSPEQLTPVTGEDDDPLIP